MNKRSTDSMSATEDQAVNPKTKNKTGKSVKRLEKELAGCKKELDSMRGVYDSIFNNAGIGIFRCTLTGEILMINRTISMMLGYMDPDELIGDIANIIDVKHLSHRSISDILKIITNSKDFTTFNVGLRRKDGGVLIAALKVKAVPGDSGKPEFIDGIVEDVTFRKEIETQIAEAWKRAESANFAKSEFLANMSHEIRTPINGVIGATKILLASDLSEEHREILEIVQESANSLAIIVNDILDFSKIEAGKLEILEVDFNLWETLIIIKRVFSLEAVKKGLDLKLRILPGVPVTVCGDPNRLGQVIRNLVSNAIKFTDEGEVRIKVETIGEKDSGSWILFTVSDTGIGIWEDNIPKLFKTFSQLGSSYSKKVQGTGLGLAICKKLSKLMGGDVWAESRRGEGSVFYFRIPHRKAHLEASQLKSGESKDFIIESPVAASKNILIADDNLLSRKICSHVLRKAGHRITTVANGVEAITRLEQEPFDLILMDIRMPELDGIETTKQIRAASADRFDPQTPIIALTAYAMDSERETFFRAGINDYISKPIHWNKLFLKIAQATSSHIRENVPYQAQDTEHSNFVTDIRNLIARFPDQNEFLRELFSNFMEETPVAMSDLEAAVKANDCAAVRHAAHSIVNIAGFIQAHSAVEISRKIELAAEENDMEAAAVHYRELNRCIDAVIHYLKSGSPV